MRGAKGKKDEQGAYFFSLIGRTIGAWVILDALSQENDNEVRANESLTPKSMSVEVTANPDAAMDAAREEFPHPISSNKVAPPTRTAARWSFQNVGYSRPYLRPNAYGLQGVSSCNDSRYIIDKFFASCKERQTAERKIV